VHSPEPRRYTLWFGQRGPLIIPFCSHLCININLYLDIEWEQKRTSRGVSVVWIKIIFNVEDNICILLVQTNKIIWIKSCFIWKYSKTNFASMNRTLSIRLSHEIKRSRICIYICRIKSVVWLFVNTLAAYSKLVMICVYMAYL
jgi:hypothetical protein